MSGRATRERRLAVNLSLIFTEIPLLARFDAAAALGFKGVEIQFPYEESPGDLKLAAERAGVEIALFNVPAGDLMTGGPGLAGCPGREAAFEAALEQCARYVDALKPDCVNVLGGRVGDGQTREQCLDTFVCNIERARHRLKPYGVTTVFEAINRHDVPGSLISTTAEQLDILRRLADPDVRLQIDLYHMARMGEVFPLALPEALPHTAHIQFADVPGRNEPGTGSLDFSAAFALIAQSEYAGWLAAEYRPGDESGSSFDWLRRQPFSDYA